MPSKECASSVVLYRSFQKVVKISPSLLSESSNIALSTAHKATSEETGFPFASFVEISTVTVSPGPKFKLFGVKFTAIFLLSGETIILV
ncbi:MAG: hypothetical protein ACD_38C00129G0001 [uncultured bacterium]|nr:MAG: hypothetical protein ACD_38C00129G0001 [uncultured bacterium]